jgi:nitronate monooxygenase
VPWVVAGGCGIVGAMPPAPTSSFASQLGLAAPVVCGAMYPCSNPELVAAVSEAGGLGIVQPISLTYAHGHEFRAGLRFIRQRTKKPIGVNLVVEQSNQKYLDRMRRYLLESLEEGIRFFITSLGNPKWVVDEVERVGGVVYHDVTERKWAQKAVDGGVRGLIAVNNLAGGHAGGREPKQLLEELLPLNLPVLCAGGVGNARQFADMLALGYQGVQLGTRFIASQECTAHDDYKAAIVQAQVDDIVLTERLSGVPVAVIKTPYVERLGTKAGPLARWLLRNPKTKHHMRTLYTLLSVYKLKRGLKRELGKNDYWQAGRSVAGIDSVLPVATILKDFTEAWQAHQTAQPANRHGT